MLPPQSRADFETADPPSARIGAVGALVVLLWPVCAAGAALGMIAGILGEGTVDRSGSGHLVGWALAGVVTGVLVAGLLLGWIWAVAARRSRAEPVLACALAPAVAALAGIPLILQVPGSSADGLRIACFAALIGAASALVWFAARHSRPRRFRPADGATDE